jgi:uncharacterized membrane protein
MSASKPYLPGALFTLAGVLFLAGAFLPPGAPVNTTLVVVGVAILLLGAVNLVRALRGPRVE